MLLFFVSSSMLSKLVELTGPGHETPFEKGNQRDVLQVLANGGISGCLALAARWTGGEPLVAAYLGSLAAATADTWGTEIGMLSRSRPWLVSTMRRVDAGTSGAVSLPGLAGGCAGAFVIGVSGSVWADGGIVRLALIAATAGLGGSLTDSLLGASFQAQYRCGRCGLLTERRVHCGNLTVRSRGLGWLTNDVVNLACTFTGAILGYALSSAWV
jgi:uncharacterized protein (TIGR00297 family)